MAGVRITQFVPSIVASRRYGSFAGRDATTPTRGRIGWAEQEVPGATPTRGRMGWAEVEVPFVPTRGRIAWAESEVPFVGSVPIGGVTSCAAVTHPAHCR